jgi:hypothetical protein
VNLSNPINKRSYFLQLIGRMTVAGIMMVLGMQLSFANEIDVRNDLAIKVFNALNTDNFSDLDAMANEFRSAKGRTPSGLWKLSFFYLSIGQILTPAEGAGEQPWLAAENKIKRWIAQSPNSPAAHIVYGKLLRMHAWHIRGGGYANQVAKAKWPGFEKYEHLALEYLESHKNIASADPEWYATMLAITTDAGLERAKFDSIYEEALNKESAYYETYFWALRYLLPIWHGDSKQMEVFIDNAVKRSYKTEGSSMYARMYWSASQVLGDNIFEKSNAKWPKMKAAFDDMVKRYPDSWNINNYAKFACLAGDKQTTHLLIKKMKGDVIDDAWPSVEFYNACRQ